MILGLGLWELALLLGLLIAIFGLGRFPEIARDLGRLQGTLQRIRRRFPWLGRIPWLSRFLR